MRAQALLIGSTYIIFRDKCKISSCVLPKLQIAQYRIKVNTEVHWTLPNKQFSPQSQILLKHLTNSVRCDVSANKIVTHVTLNKKNPPLALGATPSHLWGGPRVTLRWSGVARRHHPQQIQGWPLGPPLPPLGLPCRSRWHVSQFLFVNIYF